MIHVVDSSLFIGNLLNTSFKIIFPQKTIFKYILRAQENFFFKAEYVSAWNHLDLLLINSTSNL